MALRLVGLSTDGNIAAFRYRTRRSRRSGFWRALERRATIVDVVCPQLPRLVRSVYRVRHFRRDPGIRFASAFLRPGVFRAWQRTAERRLEELDGCYDLIVQDGGWTAAGTQFRERPYVLFTDATYRIFEQTRGNASPLRGRERTTWLALETETYRHASFIFPYSEFCRRSLIEDYGCDPERVVAVGAGLNITPEPASAHDRHDHVALFVGFDFAGKGGDTVLAAWPEVRQAIPDAELWIVGPPARPNRLAGVRWLGPERDQRRLARLYAQASVFVLPSLTDAWGHVFLEAMAHGLPCIGANHLAMPEIIEHDRTGVLVRPGIAGDVRDALIRLLGDREQARQMGTAARASLEGRTWDDVIERILAHLDEHLLVGAR